MGRRALNPNDFQSAEYAILDAAKAPSVPNEEIWGNFNELIQFGTLAFASDPNKPRVARIMNKTLMKLADVTVVPPFNEMQQESISAAYSTWSQLTEQIVETPKEVDNSDKTESNDATPKRPIKPTDTNRINTGSVKF